MSMLDRKLRRDLARLWAQVLAIALVMACGVATLILAIGAYRSLDETRAAFYDRYRFADASSRSATRAPLRLEGPTSVAFPDVAAVELRIVGAVLLDMHGMAEPGTGIAVSIPDLGDAERQPALPARRPASGSRPTGRGGGIRDRSPSAHHLHPGDTFTRIMNGKKRTLRVSGIVLSPEYVYAIGPGDMVPDPRRFGVILHAAERAGRPLRHAGRVQRSGRDPCDAEQTNGRPSPSSTGYSGRTAVPAPIGARTRFRTLSWTAS